MKPTEVKKTIQVTYWTCANASHNHRSEAVATACIEKHDRRSAAKPKNKWTTEMLINAAEMILNGSTIKAAGEHYGVSPGRMRQVMAKALRRMWHPSIRIPDPVPNHDATNLEEFREHKAWWQKQIDHSRELLRPNRQ